MMQWLVLSSLKARVLVVALAIGLLVAGYFQLKNAPLDVFPEFAPPLVEIQTEAPGLSAIEVESLVSVPLEDALSGTSWVTSVRSKSVPGLSSIVLHFGRGTDLLRARQLVAERISVAGNGLPSAARPPVILSPMSSTSRAMKIGLWSDKISLIELSTLARWTIRPRLLAVPGVANVAIWGQRDRQLQLVVEPERLRAHGVTLEEVTKAAGAATSPMGGGFIDTPNQRLNVVHLPAVHDAKTLSDVVVPTTRGAPLRLGDVGTVTEGHQPLIGDAVINDGLGILLIVEKQPWGNTLDLTREVEKALAALKPALKDVHVDPTIFRPATFIEKSLDNLGSAMALGCLLVIVVLFLFLYEWRTAVISATAIPLSLVAAGLVLYYRGEVINTMVLAGLVLALGEVVDDAIIDVENIARRLRLATPEEREKSALSTVLSASLEMRSAIVYATLIVVLAFLPVFMMEGLSGAFFKPLALSYVIAVVASLLVALTVTPALCLLLLPKRPGAAKESPLLVRLRERYRNALPALLDRPRSAISVVLVLLAGSAVLLPLLGQTLLPNFKERDFLMHWVEKPGISHPAMVRITERASKELRAIPGVRNFGSHIGRAEVADEVVGINFTELWISIDEKADYDRTLAKVEEVVNGYPGLFRDVLTYLRERIKEVLTGTSASIVVRLYGPDLGVLATEAERIRAGVASVPGVADLKVEPLSPIPQIEVEVDLPAAQRFGLTPHAIQSAAATFVRGTKVGEIYEQQKVFDVVVRGADHLKSDARSVAELLLDTPSGGQVRLRDVARVRLASGPGTIKREGASRRLDVSCNVKGRDLGGVAKDIEARLGTMSFPRGYHPELLGEYQELGRTATRMRWAVGGTLLAMFLLLYTCLGKLRLAVIAFGTLPFALVGGIVAAAVFDGTLSLGTLIGFITVLGIAARNGIMLVSHFQHLEQQEGVPFGRELVLRGAEERLAPIAMTALTTALALVPLVVAGNQPGHEIEHPMALVILGGLVSSTLLNLFFLPSLYLRYGRVPAPGVAK
jgi:CzcA family heavy metal efflux pump